LSKPTIRAHDEKRGPVKKGFGINVSQAVGFMADQPEVKAAAAEAKESEAAADVAAPSFTEGPCIVEAAAGHAVQETAQQEQQLAIQAEQTVVESVAVLEAEREVEENPEKLMREVEMEAALNAGRAATDAANAWIAQATSVGQAVTGATCESVTVLEAERAVEVNTKKPMPEAEMEEPLDVGRAAQGTTDVRQRQRMLMLAWGVKTITGGRGQCCVRAKMLIGLRNQLRIPLMISLVTTLLWRRWLATRTTTTAMRAAVLLPQHRHKDKAPSSQQGYLQQELAMVRRLWRYLPQVCRYHLAQLQ